jgi:inosine/xanthosine triphosphate pyrophosphatase family protein
MVEDSGIHINGVDIEGSPGRALSKYLTLQATTVRIGATLRGWDSQVAEISTLATLMMARDHPEYVVALLSSIEGTILAEIAAQNREITEKIPVKGGDIE